MPNATTVGRKINSPKLKKMAVYGQDVGAPRTGVNNIDLLLQGPVKLKRTGSSYEVTSSIHTKSNGQPISGLYEPILLAVYKGDRSDYGIKNARLVLNAIGGRRITQMI